MNRVFHGECCGKERGAVLLGLTIIIVILGLTGIGFMARAVFVGSEVKMGLRQSQSYLLSETATALVPDKIARQDFSLVMNRMIFDPNTALPGIRNAEDIWGESSPRIFKVSDPNLQRGVITVEFLEENDFPYMIVNTSHPHGVKTTGSLYYTSPNATGSETLVDERKLVGSVTWLTRNFEYPLFLGEIDYTDNKDPDAGNLLVSFGSAESRFSVDDAINGLYDQFHGYIEAPADPSEGLYPWRGLSQGGYTACTEGPAPTFRVSLPAPRQTPLKLDDMHYAQQNHTYKLNEASLGNYPELSEFVVINPTFSGSNPDFRAFPVNQMLNTDTSMTMDAVFFGPSTYNLSTFYDTCTVNLGTDRVYYVDGHAFFLAPICRRLEITGRATIIARGNIYIYNDIVYRDPDKDMLVLIALGDDFRSPYGNPIDMGNIFISDPWLDTVQFPPPNRARVERVDAVLFAARDFFYNVSWQEMYPGIPSRARLRYALSDDFAPFEGPFPYRGLTINGALTVQSLGVGYTSQNRNKPIDNKRKHVAPFIRRDMYSWASRVNINTAADITAENLFDSVAFYDSLGGGMWWGLGTCPNQDAEGCDLEPFEGRFDDRWDNSTGEPTDDDDGWFKLDGTINPCWDNSSGTHRCDTNDPDFNETWHSAGLIDWAWDTRLDPPVAVHWSKNKSKPALNNVWLDQDNKTQPYIGGPTYQPIVHIPLIINFDDRLSSVYQPPGLPEDNANGRIPNIHVRDWAKPKTGP